MAIRAICIGWILRLTVICRNGEARSNRRNSKSLPQTTLLSSLIAEQGWQSRVTTTVTSAPDQFRDATRQGPAICAGPFSWQTAEAAHFSFSEKSGQYAGSRQENWQSVWCTVLMRFQKRDRLLPRFCPGTGIARPNFRLSSV
ncbi:MAG: hypothetical protein GYB27_14980 [Rhodobacteraceae bacterium]|nr:hypothetical protein [Paracoccaceae bacterium]